MTNLYDRILETSTTTGTGTFSLAGAETGYRTFSSVANGTPVYYTIEHGAEWECGIGTPTNGSPNTLARTTVTASSNGGSLVSFSGGTKRVFISLTAEAYEDMQGSTGPAGAAGPNTVTTSTSTNLTGYLYADGSSISATGSDKVELSVGVNGGQLKLWDDASGAFRTISVSSGDYIFSTGGMNVSGNVNANTFSGDGSGLYNLDAGSIGGALSVSSVAANSVSTSGNVTAGGHLSVGDQFRVNSGYSSGSTLGSVVGGYAIYDSGGTLKGILPIYDSIS